MIIIPRNKNGNPLSEGQHVAGEREAWKQADEMIEEDEQVAYVSLREASGEETNQLWRTSLYTGWVKTPEH